jgi:hypothetical protein
MGFAAGLNQCIRNLDCLSLSQRRWPGRPEFNLPGFGKGSEVLAFTRMTGRDSRPRRARAPTSPGDETHAGLAAPDSE